MPIRNMLHQLLLLMDLQEVLLPVRLVHRHKAGMDC